MKRFPSLPGLACIVLAATTAARADSTYTYTLAGNQVTITGLVSASGVSGALTIPATVDGYTVVALGRGVFKNQSGLTSVGFASGSSVTKIGLQAFQGCTALTSATLPAGVTAVPAGAFLGCTALASVSLPAGVTTIGAAAFADCASLTGVTLPSGLTALGESAFQNCSALNAVTVPSGVTALPAHAFDGCGALASVSLPSGLTTIGAGAFADVDALTLLTLPASVTTVGAGAFRGCDALASLVLGSGVATLGDEFVEGCHALAVIMVAAGNTTYASDAGALLDAAKTTLLLVPPALAGSYAVPSTVTTIAPGAFAHCRALAAVTLPAGLTTLPEGAFYYASGLTTLTLPASLATIDAWAVGGCSGLTAVTLPASLTALADDAFHFAASLASATFEGDAPTMGDAVFDNPADGFTIYYAASATGFTSPTWMGYAAEVIGSTSSAVAQWLENNGYAATTDLTSDPDGDGVPLLLAYAFGLDPTANLAASVPQPEVIDGYLTLSFRAGAEGITYTPQTSTDLATWTTEGVTLSGPDAEGYLTVLVPVSDTRVFVRVLVETIN